MSGPAALLADPALLRVFVYGTLKTGQRNHAAHCRDASGRATAAVAGRALQRPEGYPTLFAPCASLGPGGTTDAAEDLRRQRDFAPKRLPETAPPWRLVRGEVFFFSDAAAALRRLDRLEDFHPGAPSEYVRVLVPVLCRAAVFGAWVYVSPHCARFERVHAG